MAHQPPTGIPRYRDRIFNDQRHDPYQARGKYKEPTVCADCGTLFEKGRWRWASSPPEAHQGLCPACQRTRDDYPAGSVTLEGEFLKAHRDELLHLVRNEADAERSEHPIHRIMRIDEEGEALVVTTTDVHSPRRIAHALESAYRGDLEIRYGEDEYTVRVHWQR